MAFTFRLPAGISNCTRHPRRLQLESLEHRLTMSVGSITEALAVAVTAGPMPDPAADSPNVSNQTSDAKINHATETGFERFHSLAEIKERLIHYAVEQYKTMFGKDYAFPILGYSWNRSLEIRLSSDLAEATAFTAALNTASYSGTNTQVAGVDEADLMETDGNYLYMLTGGDLVIIDVRTVDHPLISARLQVNHNVSSMYLSGDRLTLTSRECDDTDVSVFDVSDRAAPKFVQRTKFDGTLVDSRAIGDKVYLVFNHRLYMPRPDIVNQDGTPIDYNNLTPRSDIQGRYETEAEYRLRMEGYLEQHSLPTYTSYDAEGKEIAHDFVFDPRDFYKPDDCESLHEFCTVAVIDMKSNVHGPDASVMIPGGSVNQVYASDNSLYLLGNKTEATDMYSDNTLIRKVVLSGHHGKPEFVAKGVVPGHVLDQFSVDEHDGRLRIATTRYGSWWNSPGMQNDLYVLEQHENSLAIIGSLTGLAQGEKIYSVRFAADKAFVVTFHKVDPLFTVDLSDPQSPQVKGELILPGFSNYLQLVEGGLLLGLGRRTSDDSKFFADPQVSLFDVNDLANPKLLDRFTIPTGRAGSLGIFDDHHVVSYYTESRILTVSVPEEGSDYSTVNDLYVFRIVTVDGAAKLELLGKIEHNDSVMRSVQIDNRLISISAETIEVHELTNPAEVLATLTVNEPGSKMPGGYPGFFIGNPIIGWPIRWPTTIDIGDWATLVVLPFLSDPPVKIPSPSDPPKTVSVETPAEEIAPMGPVAPESGLDDATRTPQIAGPEENTPPVLSTPQPTQSPMIGPIQEKQTEPLVVDSIYSMPFDGVTEETIPAAAPKDFDLQNRLPSIFSVPADFVFRSEAASTTLPDDATDIFAVGSKPAFQKRGYAVTVQLFQNADPLSARKTILKNSVKDHFSASMDFPNMDALYEVKSGV